MQAWIYTSDELPTKDENGVDPYVWYYFELIGVIHGRYSVEDSCFYATLGYAAARDVKCWMPAPKPPKPPTKLRDKTD